MRAAAGLLLLGAAGIAACSDTGERPVAMRPLSYLALRYEATVAQSFDYTCGASSVATLLTYYWGRPTSETEVVEALRSRYSIAEIAQRRDTGLSFDDLIFASQRLGFAAEGARMAPSELAKLDGPVIVHLDKGKFQHFAVLRRVGDGVYYVSDPIVGELSMSSAEFEAQFSGNVLAVWKEGADLPKGAVLSRPRDGVSVHNAIDGVINAPPSIARPIL